LKGLSPCPFLPNPFAAAAAADSRQTFLNGDLGEKWVTVWHGAGFTRSVTLRGRRDLLRIGNESDEGETIDRMATVMVAADAETGVPDPRPGDWFEAGGRRWDVVRISRTPLGVWHVVEVRAVTSIRRTSGREAL